jgi:hypothetical protein
MGIPLIFGGGGAFKQITDKAVSDLTNTLGLNSSNGGDSGKSGALTDGNGNTTKYTGLLDPGLHLDDQSTYNVLAANGVYLLDFSTLYNAFHYSPANDKIPFSPFSFDLQSVENLFLLIMIAKLMQTPEGLKQLTGLYTKQMESVTSMVLSLSKAGMANPLTGALTSMLNSSLLHRFGLIDDAGYLRATEHMRTVSDRLNTLATIDSVSTIVTDVADKAVNFAGLMKSNK